MPYEIKKVRSPKNSYKVCKKIGNKECYSKKGLPYKRALAQMRAIIISELNNKKYSKKGSAKKGSAKKGSAKKSSKKPVKKSSKKQSKKMSKVKPIKPVKSIKK
jgi:hypothetical protein